MTLVCRDPQESLWVLTEGWQERLKALDQRLVAGRKSKSLHFARFILNRNWVSTPLYELA